MEEVYIGVTSFSFETKCSISDCDFESENTLTYISNISSATNKKS